MRCINVAKRVARNSQWGAVLWVWGQSPQLPEANGDLRVKPPDAGGTGAWGRSPQRLKILHFFAKITSF